MLNIGIIGSGAWGTTLSILLSERNKVTMWCRNEYQARKVQKNRHNDKLSVKHNLPDNINVTSDIDEVTKNKNLIVVTLPANTIREFFKNNKLFFSDTKYILSASKGIEINTGKRISEIIISELPEFDSKNIGVMSGPNLAYEILKGKVATATIAFSDESSCKSVQDIFNSKKFRTYTSNDIIGVELGGSLKNIIAIGAGFIDGAGLGDNSKSAFVTRGLHEIMFLGLAMGARIETFAGLSGMGDLMATCYSKLSRNYSFGYGLAKGKKTNSIMNEISQTIEGYPTTLAAYTLSEKYNIEMPIVKATKSVLYDKQEPKLVINDLLSRTLQEEKINKSSWDMKINRFIKSISDNFKN